MSATTLPATTLDTRLAQRQRPAGRPAMYQRWQDLLFLHWRMDPSIIAAKLPQRLTLDTFDGAAWVGLVPFFMRNIRPWWSPTVPGISNFQEINLRTYAVDENGIPGVWFLSLDANTRLGVWWGRTWYGLPYSFARTSYTRSQENGEIDYRSHRPGTDKRTASRFTYRSTGPRRIAEPGTLEFFLLERYVLFSADAGSRIATGRVHHPPYEYSDAESTADDALFELNKLPRPGRPPDHAVVSPGVDVEVFALETAPN